MKGIVVGLCNMKLTVGGDIVSSIMELLLYVSWGGCLEDGGNGVMTYKRGNNRCIWVADNGSADGIRKLVGEAMGEGGRGWKLWHT